MDSSCSLPPELIQMVIEALPLPVWMLVCRDAKRIVEHVFPLYVFMRIAHPPREANRKEMRKACCAAFAASMKVPDVVRKAVALLVEGRRDLRKDMERSSNLRYPLRRMLAEALARSGAMPDAVGDVLAMIPLEPRHAVKHDGEQNLTSFYNRRNPSRAGRLGKGEVKVKS